MKDKIFYLTCFGFAAGVIVRSFVRIDWKMAAIIGLAYLLAVALSFIILKFKKSQPRQNFDIQNFDIYISIFVIAFIIGIVRFQMADMQAPAFFEGQVGKTVSFSAMIVDEPVENITQVKLILETNRQVDTTVIHANEAQSKSIGTSTVAFDKGVGTYVETGVYDNVHTIAMTAKKDIQVGGTSSETNAYDIKVPAAKDTMTSKNQEIPNVGVVVFSKLDQRNNKSDKEFHYGDMVQVSGKLAKPADFMTDQDMEFDYVDYLRKDGIFYTMKDPQIVVVSEDHGNFIKRWLFSWRERFDAAIARAIPTPESTVLGGIILGERYAFSPELRQIFMDTGTIHIVTIGGYHVTLVAQWIMKIFSFLPRFAGTGVGIIGIFLYVIATGGAQTSIRAGIMATIALFGSATGRAYASGRALVLAAVIMILINPFILLFDVSFELSFMATVAIIFLSPHLEPYFEWIPWKWLRGIVTITCSMYAFALPFVLYRIGNLSLVALPANLAVVPLMPVTMIAGFVTGFAGLVSPWLAIIPGRIATSLLYFQISAVALLARLPFAAIAIQDFSLPIIAVVYAIFLFIFWKGGSEVKSSEPKAKNQKKQGLGLGTRNFRLFILLSPLAITFCAAGILYYGHFRSDQNSLGNIYKLLSSSTTAPASSSSLTGSTNTSTSAKTLNIFTPDPRTTSSDCKINGAYPDHSCTPGAVFADATVQDICIKGYTASVRNVSEKTKKQVFEEYGIPYPQPAGAYEVDHFIPLALGGANDIANLFPEAAVPTPGFHEKDIVEVFLQEQVCSGHADLSAAQRQISTDWLAVYNNIPFEDKQRIKEKYGGSAVQ